jgi:hypothetical protein
MTIIEVNVAISENVDLNPPAEDVILTMELSTITAITIKIMTV